VTRFVLDASFALAWVFSDEADEVSRTMLERLGAVGAVVPEVLWDLEIGNTLLGAARQGRLTAEAAAENKRLLDAFPIERVEFPVGAAFDTARVLGLTTYDAAYLVLALGMHLPLATHDDRLREAALRAGAELVGTR
jgi:predicted nucleic acid-binding protein